MSDESFEVRVNGVPTALENVSEVWEDYPVTPPTALSITFETGRRSGDQLMIQVVRDSPEEALDDAQELIDDAHALAKRMEDL